MDRIHLAGKVRSPTTAGVSPGHPLGYSASFDLSSHGTVGTSPTPSTALSTSSRVPSTQLCFGAQSIEVRWTTSWNGPVRSPGWELVGEERAFRSLLALSWGGHMSSEIPCWEKQILSMRNRDPAGKGKGKERERGREAAAWPLRRPSRQFLVPGLREAQLRPCSWTPGDTSCPYVTSLLKELDSIRCKKKPTLFFPSVLSSLLCGLALFPVNPGNAAGPEVSLLLTVTSLQTVQGRAQKPGLPQPGQAGGLEWGGTRSVHQSPPPPGPLSFVALGVGTDVTDEGEARAHLMWPLRLEPELAPCVRAHCQHARSVFSSLCFPFSLFAAASSEFPSWAPLTQLPLWE